MKQLRLSIVCGHFRFDGGAGHPLLEALPPLLHLRVQGSKLPNYATMFLQAVRGWIDTLPDVARCWMLLDR